MKQRVSIRSQQSVVYKPRVIGPFKSILGPESRHSEACAGENVRWLGRYSTYFRVNMTQVACTENP